MFLLKKKFAFPVNNVCVVDKYIPKVRPSARNVYENDHDKYSLTSYC